MSDQTKIIHDLLGIVGTLTLRISRLERKMKATEKQLIEASPGSDLASELNKIRKTLYKGNGDDPLVKSVKRLTEEIESVQTLNRKLAIAKKIVTGLLFVLGGTLFWFFVRN